MDSFELNKIIGALLGIVFVIFSVNLISHAVFSSHAPETPGYAIEVPEDDGQATAEAEQEQESVLPLLADADPSAGENVFKRCQACHTVEQGGPNKVGPNLWDVVNRPVAGHEGFGYSGALQEFAQGGDVTWTYENLDHFLADPRGFVPGTAMAFAGLNKIEDRANVIAYLRTLSDDPAPLPEVSADDGEEAGGEDAAPAEGDGEAAPADDASGDATSAESTPDAADGSGDAPAADQAASDDAAQGEEQEEEPAASSQ